MLLVNTHILVYTHILFQRNIAKKQVHTTGFVEYYILICIHRQLPSVISVAVAKCV